MKKYYPIIGLEVHIELNTISKMFCQCRADYFNKEPNSEVCPVCLGLPGALPVPNKKAIEYTQMIAKALGCKLNLNSHFDRKHYFYPDLPKGYQISQYEEPFGIEGKFELKNKTIHIRRVHLEEDTGRLIHKSEASFVDFNRSGVPLVEIVTEPDFDNSDDVKQYLEYLHILVQQYLKVSDANMEEGSMRLEPNISLTLIKENLPNYKIEIKNINSFRYVKKAIDYEIKRQEEMLIANKILKNETRGFNENKNITFAQRSKEDAKDYRYFPEPDIPPFSFTEKDFSIISLPELPYEKYNRFLKKEKLSEYQSSILMKNIVKANIYDKLVLKYKEKVLNSKIANFIINKVVGDNLNNEVNLKDYLSLEKGIPADIIVQISEVFNENKKAVIDYKSGKGNAVFFLMGKIIQKIGNKVDIEKLKTIVIEELKK